MKNYVITGATGHLGNTLVNQILNTSADNIKLLVLPNEDVSIYNSERVTIVYGNILDKAFLEREISKDNIVIHMAGIVDISAGNKDLLYKVNIEGTRNIASVCYEKQVDKFVYTSSVHVIPCGGAEKVLSEPTDFNADNVVGDYAKSKCAATDIVFDYARKGLNATVVYPSGIIGPNDIRLSNIGQLIVDIANKSISARVSGGYNFVDVRDCANGVLLATEKGENNRGYILSGNKVSVAELFTAVQAKFGRSHLVPRLATWFVNIFVGFIEWVSKVKKEKPLFTKYSLYTLHVNHDFSHKRATEELGYTTRPAKESFSDAVDWLIEKKSDLFNEKATRDYLYTEHKKTHKIKLSLRLLKKSKKKDKM